MSTQVIHKIYKTQPAEGFEWVHPVAQSDYELFRFDGTPRVTRWFPVKVERSTHDENRKRLEPGDFPPGCGFVVSRAAKEYLGPCLEAAGELLPLDCPDGEFWTLNVTRLVDALDEEGSEVLRSTETGRILMVHRPRFHASRLGPEIFKLPQTPRSAIYVSEEFVKKVKTSPLKGLDFKLVWAVN